MIINTETYPLIMKSMDLILDDTGSRLKIPVRDIPSRWEKLLPRIEETLKSFSQTERAPEEEPLAPHIKPNAFLDSEYYTFCNGEYSAQVAIANRSMDNTLAYIFLNDFFEDWSFTEEDHERNPENLAKISRLEYFRNQEITDSLTSQQKEEMSSLETSLT